MKLGALAVAALVPACAWDAGEPYGTVELGLAARYTPRADRGGTWQKLASDFEVELTTGRATLGPLTLVDRGTAAATVDPADPPPGYSLCHNGHCHAEDGRLVSYEDIAAELGGDGGAGPVLVLAVGDRELVPGGEAALACEGACDLPRAAIGRIELGVARLELAGRVRDTRMPPRIAGELAWTLALDRVAGATPVTAEVDLPIDRGEDPRIALAVAFAPTAALLDGVPFERAATDPWDLDADARRAVDAALVELPLDVHAERTTY